MDKQKIVTGERSCAATLAGGTVESVRFQEEERTSVRVYEGGKIGVAGRIGGGDDAALEQSAREALAYGIPYPSALCGGEVRSADTRTEILSEIDFLPAVKKLAARLKERFPSFIFSNKISMEEGKVRYTDSAGTDLFYAGNAFIVSLTVKEAASANIMDLAYGAVRGYYDEDAIVSDLSKLLDVYGNVLALPEEELPVIIDANIVQYLLGHFMAETYQSGAGLLSGKMGQKIFGDEVDILLDRMPGKEPLARFFDDEGVTLPGDKFYFVKEGRLCGLAAYRRTAAEFSLPLSGCGCAPFDGAPMCGNFSGLEVDAHGKKLSEAVKGRAIYISVVSGGDMTPDGKFATPVMCAYLYEDGKLAGRLPEFGISGNIFDLFGKNMLAIAENDLYGYTKETVLVSRFSIDKK